MLRRTLATLVVLVPLLAGPAQRLADAPAAGPLAKLENLSRVSDAVIRSGQPDREQFAALAREMGVRSVLNLRRVHDDGDEAKGLGLSLYHVPMRAGSINREEIAKAVRILDECPKPVLVHCWHGSDRTGCVVAVYRMVFQDWSKERAVAEFKSPSGNKARSRRRLAGMPDAEASEGRCWNHRKSELTKSGARPALSLRARAAGVAWPCWPPLTGHHPACGRPPCPARPAPRARPCPLCG